MELIVEATFGFVDLAGFSALTDAHGDQRAVDVLDRFEAIVEASLGPRDRLVKTIGDAVMIAFVDPDAALEATVKLFEACVAEPDMALPRAGLHHGEAIDRSGDFIGAAVNLAARVTAQAHGGQVLGTEPVAQVARRRGVHVVDLGSFNLHNLVVAVELFELALCPAAAGNTTDPVCRMQVARANAAGRLRHADVDYWFCSLECAASFAAEPGRFVLLAGGTAG